MKYYASSPLTVFEFQNKIVAIYVMSTWIVDLEGNICLVSEKALVFL